jgi:hypothetical protein
MWLNSMPSATGISTQFSPRELVLRTRLKYKQHCRTPFGAYCEVHEDNAPTNSMMTRTTPAICLGPTGNLQGTYLFFSLVTGQILRRRRWTELPVPDSVIARVAHFAQKSGNPPGLTFTDRQHHEYTWSDDDIVGSDDPPTAPFSDISADTPGVQLDRTPSSISFHDLPSDYDTDTAPNDDPDWAQMADDALANADIDDGEVLPPPPEVIVIDDDEDVPLPSPIKQTLAYLPKVEPDNSGPTSTPLPFSPNVRRNPPRARAPPQRLADYHLFTTVAADVNTSFPYTDARGRQVDLAITDENHIAHVCHYVMLHCAESTFIGNPNNKKQYGLKAGLRKFAERGNDALMKELRQFHVLRCFSPKDPKTLSRDDRRKALSSLMFLTEKRSGEVKARGCADGSKQRDHIAKEEATAPTVTSDAIFIQSTIFAHEDRDIATCDIPGAFLQVDNPDYVLMRLDGILAELMVTIAPNIYRKYITTTAKGKPVLYVQLEKALYGMMKSALLFYRKLVADLKSIGFAINPYDPCVANKDVDGHQLTVCWHVDDLLIGHKKRDVVTRFTRWLQQRYETPDKPLKATRGPIHDYLGMNINFSTPKTVSFDMIPYIKKILNEFPEKITGVASSPAADHLFKIRDPKEARLLPESQAIAYHHATAQLLFLSRVRRDIQTAVAFLTTRVKAPDEDDWGKLKRVLKYLFGTRFLKLTLSADSLSILRWYVDASHQIHDDCKGHTGALLLLGAGAVISSSNKQKLNTKSSTESELVAVHDKSGDVLWVRNFLEAQGYTISENIIFQDNMSTLSLEKNGRLSSSKRTKHIKAKYFFIKHYYDTGEINLRYCPTEHMWADVLTKPLQGAQFRQMRSILMNCPIDYTEDPPLLSSIPMESSTIHPMKPRLLRTKLSPRECVEVTSSSRTPKSGGKKKITWRDHPEVPCPATSKPWRARELDRPLPVTE